MKKIISLLLAMVMVLSLVACGAKEEAATPAATEAAPAATEAATEAITEAAPEEETVDPNGTHIVVDDLGREVEIPNTVERIAALGQTQRYLVYLGMSEKIVGASKITGDNISGVTPTTPFAFVNKDLWADLATIGDGNGDDFYPEAILMAEPDVIVCSTISEEAALNLADQIGIPTVFVNTGNLFSEEMNNAFLLLGEVCGVEERAQEVVDYINASVADIKSRTTDVPDESKLTALSAAATFRGAHGIEGVRLKDDMLITLSAINVAADSYDGAASAEVDREKILEWNPDVIFCDCSGVKLVMEDEATNPEYYQQLQAYNNGTMYQHPSNTSYYSNVEIPVANLYYMGSILYPEQFADIDVVEKINEVMKFFVGVDDYYTMLADAGQGYGPLDFGN